ncbi:uncharacterized protein LOC123403501 [Hordeum vulgare subsp. vulgare]|uniref:KIB1-4 beta-propeller domain-containing protein n=1 Tax=Hordeum vulgare subsp. vulgare TaxID=112509 RepID=A0A8I6XZM4_HORVV|nr:uncharacterized protein LOC123403501 [Hordeum vulgare subsp. vulgare]
MKWTLHCCITASPKASSLEEEEEEPAQTCALPVGEEGARDSRPPSTTTRGLPSAAHHAELQQTVCRLSPRPPAFSGPQGWADLPDGLLHSIVARLGSFRDLLGFAAACPSWRGAFSSYPSKSMFRTKLPPLLIQPHVRRLQGPLLPSTDGFHELLTCKVVDPANLNTALHCQIPQGTLENMVCIGSSCGNLIYYCDGYCHIVDVFTGVEVSTPRLPSSAKTWKFWFSGILTAPLASPNSHLLVSTDSSLFDWHVGSNSWSELRYPDLVVVDQIVEFNGQFLLSDGFGSIYALQLAPQLSVQEITTEIQDWSEELDEEGWTERWRLVVCGDMLLMHNANRLHRLDMSTNPAVWIVVEKLHNWALFIGAELKNAPLSCMRPELWGGRSNIKYFASKSQTWTLVGLCGTPDPVQDAPPIEPVVGSTQAVRSSVSPLWLYPSMFYSDSLAE